MARFQEILPFAPVTSEGVISLIRWDELRLQNALNTPCEVDEGHVLIRTESANRSAPMQPYETAEDISGLIAAANNE